MTPPAASLVEGALAVWVRCAWTTLRAALSWGPGDHGLWVPHCR